MKKYISSALALALVSTFMVGCSDDDDNNDPIVKPTEFNGKYALNRSVQGVDYTCDTKTGTTDADGVFGPCPIGKPVTFSIDGVLLGSTVQNTSGIYTSKDLTVADSVSTEPLGAKIGSTLMTLDRDANNSNGIEVSDGAAAEFAKAMTPVAASIGRAETGPSLDETNQADLETRSLGAAQTAAAADPQATPPTHAATAADADKAQTATDEAVAAGEITPPVQPTPPPVTGAAS